MSHSLCIFGFGYTARYLTELCQNDGLEILGVARNPEKLANEERLTYEPVHFTIETFIKRNLSPTHLLISTPPTEAGDPVLLEFEPYLARISPSLQSIVYLSTTGVYGDHQGEWVDETSKPRNPGTSGTRRLTAEKSWQTFSNRHHIPLSIFRIAGIYGPYRNALRQLKEGKHFSVFKPDQVFSRIHVEDLAEAIKTTIFRPEKAGIYNICDNEPTSNTVIDSFAANLIGIDAPPHLPFEKANLSGMALEFFSSNKRVSNSKLLNALELKLLYPTYREGLTSLYRHGQF